MSGKRWIFLWLPLSLLAAERDPFQPVEDPCRTAQLSQWRYGGAVGDDAGWTGFLQDGNGKWRRVRMDEQLPTAGRVSRLTPVSWTSSRLRDANRQRGAGNVKGNNMMRWISRCF